MDNVAGWIAPFATTIAAMMTAANGGARLTGLGFVVFSVGAVAWLVYGIASGQPNLIWQNAILLAIDLFGIWRWLGRQARYESGAEAAEARSQARAQETLFSASSLAGAAIVDGSGESGELVDAMIECDSGRISYAVARRGGVAGIGETLVMLRWDMIRHDGKQANIASFDRARSIEEGDWPARAL